MTQFRKAKDRKLLLNNPPKKETHLKGSKDLDLVKDAPFSKGSFGGQQTQPKEQTSSLPIFEGKGLEFTKRNSIRFDLLAVKQAIDGMNQSQN